VGFVAEGPYALIISQNFGPRQNKIVTENFKVERNLTDRKVPSCSLGSGMFREMEVQPIGKLPDRVPT
jgi:hypothetical protein